MLNLNAYIKVDSIRRKIAKSCTIITSIDEANDYAFTISSGEYRNAIFEKSSLKNYFFSKLKDLTEANIINCNSNYDIFVENLDKEGIKVFDNINCCKNINILETVLDNKGILVC